MTAEFTVSVSTAEIHAMEKFPTNLNFFMENPMFYKI